MEFLSLNKVNFSWPGGRQVLTDISLAIHPGETVALVGANGSGKTTLGKIMVGILQPANGQVHLAGKPLGQYSLAEVGRRIGYIFQNPEKQLFTPSVREEIGFGLRHRQVADGEIKRRVQAMLELFELEYCADSFPFNLSQGEKQRLALASVLILEPEFVIFDEPTTGMDWFRKQSFRELLTLVRKRGCGYVLISHDPDLSQDSCSRILRLEGGRLHV
ncbi:MAG: ABC transporter ATP-binding protein [Firmicutes bacterium]|nr:ABC transporter ATP-binding protein [Bacillota bacterium]